MNVHGHPDHPNLVGQIFFRTDEARLGPEDLRVLEPFCEYLRAYLHRYEIRTMSRILFKLVGNADPRGAAGYNFTLAKRRAEVVRQAIDPYFARFPYYYSASESRGEHSGSRGDLAGSRRVDILTNVAIPRNESLHFDDEIVTGRYTGPKTNRFRFRTILGASVGLFGAGGSVFTVEIQNVNTGRKRYYTYSGAGGGMGVGFNRPTSWEERILPIRMSLEDFEGNGQTITFGAGKTHTKLVFKGPREKGLVDKDIELVFDGWDLVFGFEADQTGYWHLRD